MIQIIIIIATAILMILPLIIGFRIVETLWKKYKLWLFVLNEVVIILGALYILLTVVGNFSFDLKMAHIFFDSSVLIAFLMLMLTYIYFRALRAETITYQILLLCGFLCAIKIIALIINPIHIFRQEGIFLRSAHLSDLALISPIILILLLIYEVTMLYYSARSDTRRKPYASKILSSYILIIILLPVYFLGFIHPLVYIMIPYFQELIMSSIALYISVIFHRDPSKLVLIPINIKGILLHTYGGLAILREAISKDFESIVALSSALVASIIGLESAIVGRARKNFFMVHKLMKITIVMYFGEFIVGTVVTNRDNIVLRDILRNIVKEYEQEVKHVDEGMITNREIEIAYTILDNWKDFIF